MSSCVGSLLYLIIMLHMFMNCKEHVLVFDLLILAQMCTLFVLRSIVG